MTAYRIGEVTRRLGMSADTLRYYEKIGLLPRIARNDSGLRGYDGADVARRFAVRRWEGRDRAGRVQLKDLKLRTLVVSSDA